MNIFIFRHASCMVDGVETKTKDAASLFWQPRRNASMAICCITALSKSPKPSVAMLRILCIYTSSVSSSDCFAKCNFCRAATGSSLESNRSFNSPFKFSYDLLFLHFTAYSSAFSVRQLNSRSNFLFSDHLCLSAILSNFMLKLDQDPLVGSPEKDCSFGGNGDNDLSEDGDVEAFLPVLPLFVLDLPLDLDCSFPGEGFVSLVPSGGGFVFPSPGGKLLSEAPAEPFAVYISSLGQTFFILSKISSIVSSFCLSDGGGSKGFFSSNWPRLNVLSNLQLSILWV